METWLIPLITVLGGVGGVGSALVAWMTGRRKDNAEVAKIWNELTKDALIQANDRIEEAHKRTRHVSMELEDLRSRLCGVLTELEESVVPYLQTSNPALARDVSRAFTRLRNLL